MGDRPPRDRSGRSNPFNPFDRFRQPDHDDDAPTAPLQRFERRPGDPNSYPSQPNQAYGQSGQPAQRRYDTPIYPDLNGYQADPTGGALLELPAPCGKHVVYYPEALKELAERRITFYVFQAVCACGTAYLIATLPAGPRFWFGGAPQAISEAYDRIPWPEHRYLLFTCKAAPSLDEMVNYFATRLG